MTEARRIAEDKLVDVLTALDGSPLVEKQIAAKAAARLKERQDLATELAVLDGDSAHAYRTSSEALAMAEQAVKDAEQALVTARTKWGQTLNARGAACIRYGLRRDEIQNALRETASPEIDAFIRSMWDEVRSLRRRQVGVEVDESVNPITGKKKRSVRRERPSIVARMAACRQLAEDAETLKLIPDQGDIADTLAKWRAGLPEIKLVGAGDGADAAAGV